MSILVTIKINIQKTALNLHFDAKQIELYIIPS